MLMCTSGGLAVAFCTTRNSFVTISITWQVWKTKSPFLRVISDWLETKMGWFITAYTVFLIAPFQFTVNPTSMDMDG